MTAWEPETLSEFRALTEYSSDLVSVLDESGTILYQSPSAERILGEDPNERVGTNAFEYVHPDDRGRITEKFLEMVQSPGTVTERVEYRFEHGDGSWMWIESIGSNRTDTAIEGYVVNSRDITERKEKEQRLKQQNEQLDEFASVVSHDLRNPLRTAQGRLELAQAECECAHLDDVADAIDRSQALIDDLLTLARGGDTDGSLEPVSVSALTRECWEMIPEKNATLIIETSQTVLADRSRLKQLLENLLANAVEHGGEDVTVQVGDIADGFYVADDGVGIPEGEREDIFEAGYSTAEDGTGFGLRIVKQIVDTHGWEIQVTDSDDDGTRVEITEVDIVE